jgi:predicted GIY-YIG superfamily endonuclease/predicted transcriptional regulator
MYHLYYLKSTLDDKIYIGITNNPDRRYYEHINYTVEKNHHNGNWIKKTLKKGGQIKMIIALSNLSKKVAIQLEIKLISLFKKITPEKVTNTAQGGLGFNHKGIPHSDSHKKAIELAQPHKVRIPKEELYNLYVNKYLSKKKISDIYGCGTTTIDRRLNEYGIEIRKTPNYKISYKINKEDILDMYINKNMTISDISDILGIGSSGVRYLLQREGLDTGLNKFSKSVDKEKIKQKYEELIKMNIKKMKIYEILSNEFNLSSSYLCKLKL